MLKKRILSILLVLCMVLTLVPAAVFGVGPAVGDVFTANITVGKNADVECEFKILTLPAGGNGTVQIGNGTNRAIDVGSAGQLIIPASISNGGNTYTVTAIGNQAFGWCSGLTGTLNLPAGLITIGNNAFNSCSGLTGTLTIPDSVTTIGDSAFYNCPGFTGDLYLPDGLTTISYAAFSQCIGFNGNLTLPADLETIGEYAFQDCSGFTGALNIPDSVTTIGTMAFSKCSGLTGNLTLPAGVITISDSAFQDCTGFTGLTLPAAVTTIGRSAFKNCSGFTGALNIPDSVTTIGDSAFYNCSGLTGNLTLPASVTTIGDNAFERCSTLASVTLLSSSAPGLGTNSFGDFMLGDTYSIFVPHNGTGYDAVGWPSGYGRTKLSYTISGTIKGSDTDAGIPATLQLKNSSNANVGSAVEADLSGAYIIPIAVASAGNGYTIDVSCTGYENGTTSVFNVVDANIIGIDLTLTAIPITITFNANGGSVTPANATTGANGKLASLPVPSRANHRFDGWYRAASGGTQVNTDTVFAANDTIYAHWTYQGGGSGGGGGGSAMPSTSAVGTFTFTPTQLTGMISGNQAIQVENGLQITAQPQDIPRAESDTLVIQASQIQGTDTLNAFYLAYPDQQGILKGYSVTFSSENNGQSSPITQLNGEITLTFQLTEEEIRGIDSSTLVVYKQGEGGAVTTLTGTYDWENNTFSVTTDHLCDFYLMAREGIPAQRLRGANRYETAVAISRQGWKTAENIILVSGEDFPDALVAAALAGLKDAPVLLTAQDKLSPETLKEIQRIRAKNIYLLGGAAVISKGIEDQLKGNYTVRRIAGANRYETAVKLGELLQADKAGTTVSNGSETGKYAHTAILATGLNYPDSLSIAPFAGQYGIPILFTGKDTLNEQTAEALQSWGIQKIILVGGTGVITENVESTLKDWNMSVTRLKGEDRYLTSLAVARYFEQDGSYTQAAIATGESYPDALAGAALAAKENLPLLLVKKSAVSPEIRDYLQGKQPAKLFVYGGEKAIPDSVKNEISVSKK